jgi:hypothetical protein
MATNSILKTPQKVTVPSVCWALVLICVVALLAGNQLVWFAAELAEKILEIVK